MRCVSRLSATPSCLSGHGWHAMGISSNKVSSTENSRTHVSTQSLCVWMVLMKVGGPNICGSNHGAKNPRIRCQEDSLNPSQDALGKAQTVGVCYRQTLKVQQSTIHNKYCQWRQCVLYNGSVTSCKHLLSEPKTSPVHERINVTCLLGCKSWPTLLLGMYLRNIQY